MGASHAEEVEHGGLRLENGAAAKRANFQRRHGYANLEISGVCFGVEPAVQMSANSLQSAE